ncbi:MAG: Rid family hydrolase [Pseudomonadota bacterium]
MSKFINFISVAILSFLATTTAVNAADGAVLRHQENPASPFASSVYVPPGYGTYFISGIPGRTGDTPTQTAAVLDQLKKQLATLNMTFGDVVQARIFLVGDPAKGGKMDFAGMNSSWFKEFGTAEQPNKPARATVEVSGLAEGSALVEIEMVAVKRVQ